MDPNANYGLWVMRMSHCRFIGCENKYTTIVVDVDNERVNACGGQEKYEYFLYLFLNVDVIPKRL